MSSIDYSNLTVVRALDHQTRAVIPSILQQWLIPSGFSTVEEVLKLEELWNSPSPERPWAEDDRIERWCLVPRDDLDTADVLCSCITTRRRGVVLRGDDVPKEVESYCISTVMTPAKHRKRGYAKHLLRLVHYLIAPHDTLPPFPREWGAPPDPTMGRRDAAFSVLYSSVGPTFYQQCTKGTDQPGWVSYKTPPPPRRRIWTIEPQPEDNTAPPGWEWLEYDNVESLERSTSSWMREMAGSLGDSSSMRIYTPVEGGWLRQQPRRSRARMEAVGKSLPEPVIGLRQTGDTSLFFTFSVLDTAPFPRTLTVDFANHIEKIPFAAVRAAAARVGATRITLWAGYAGWDGERGELELKPPGELVPSIAQYGLVGDREQLQWLWCDHYLFL